MTRRARRLLMDPRDEAWFAVADITLCDLCGRAIQLRKVRWRHGWMAAWEHFIVPAGHYPAILKTSLWEAAREEHQL